MALPYRNEKNNILKIIIALREENIASRKRPWENTDEFYGRH